MKRLAALVTSLGQAITAVFLVVLLSNILSPSEYVQFSLALATAQFVVVGAFEWIRLGSNRFFPGLTVEDAEVRGSSILVAHGTLSVALIAGLSIALLVEAVPMELTIATVALAIGQGTCDLLLTMTRMQGHLGLFACMQAIRSGLMLFLGSLVGWYSGSASATLLTMGFVQLLCALVQLHLMSQKLTISASRFSWLELVRVSRFGSLAAAASAVHQLIPYGLRLSLAAILSGADLAGALLALDLMQRPFSAALTAVGGVYYPDVMREHLSDPGGERKKLRNFYELHSVTIGVVAVAIIVFLGEFSRFFIPTNLSVGFLHFAPLFMIFYLLHSIIQATASIPLGLNAKGLGLLANALMELVLVAVPLATFGIMFGQKDADTALLLTIAFTSVSAVLSALNAYRQIGVFQGSQASLSVAMFVALTLPAAFFTLNNPIVSAIVKALYICAIGALVAFTLRRTLLSSVYHSIYRRLNKMRRAFQERKR